MLKYKIAKYFPNFVESQYEIPNGVLAGTTILRNSINIPFTNQNRGNGYSDLTQRIIIEEKDKNVNPIIDIETFKFYSAYRAPNELNTYTDGDIVNGVGVLGPITLNYQKSPLKIKFNFYKEESGGGYYSNNFENAGFTQDEINESRNNLKNSFFRLDFYDSSNPREQNFLFSEFLNVETNKTPTFPFTRLFWYSQDSNFIEENTYREIYFTATFFDAKNGVTKEFLNNPNNSTINVVTYNQNPEWRYTKLRILNPYFNEVIFNTDINGYDGIGSENKVFYVENINGNSDENILLNEIKFQ